MLMVCLAPKPSLRLASCCSVEVMNGGYGLRDAGFASTEATLSAAAATASTAPCASASVARSKRSSLRPSSVVSRASNVSPRGVTSSAFTLQYSRGRNASISISRCTISRSATDCTRPADLAPGSLRHSTGDRVKPTR